jgi:hypothetical protein
VSTPKWIAVVLIAAGVGLLIVGLLSFRPSVPGFGGMDYGPAGKIEAASGGVLLVAGVLMLRLTR